MATKTTTDTLLRVTQLPKTAIIPVQDSTRPLIEKTIGDNQLVGISMKDLVAQVNAALNTSGYNYPSTSQGSEELKYAPPVLDANHLRIYFGTPGDYQGDAVPTTGTIVVPNGTDTSDTTKFPATCTISQTAANATVYAPGGSATVVFLAESIVTLTLSQARDAKLYPKKGIKSATFPLIKGGKNIVWIGGSLLATAPATNNSAQRGLFRFLNQTGTVFIEGIELDCNSQKGLDGFEVGCGDLSSGFPANTFYPNYVIQNCRVINTTVEILANGQPASLHPDAVQFYGSLNILYMDKNTFVGDYQNVMIDPQALVFAIYCSRINSRYTDPANRRGFGFYVNNGGVANASSPYVFLEECYQGEGVHPTNSQFNLWEKGAVYPPIDHPSTPGQFRDGRMYFPFIEGIDPRSCVIKGDPPGGDFVKAGQAGFNYVSPGYLQSAPTYTQNLRSPA